MTDSIISTYQLKKINNQLEISCYLTERNHLEMSSIPDDIARSYLDHEFDLLGSGFQRNYIGMQARGINGVLFSQKSDYSEINYSNRSQAKQIKSLIDDDYDPIDWHIDFKSGYRWKQNTWFKNIKHGHILGVDIKVPWELSRMQHLPQMAIKYISMNDSAKEKAQLKREFRNQMLDFIASNPPKYGVNWKCPMDVSIRAANCLIAYDLFNRDSQFDSAFQKIFSKSIKLHGDFIFSNLEWNYGNRNNHYIADIAGLAFISAYLKSSDETDRWLYFCINELINEVDNQFNNEGTNKEGSTTYHRLSSEMILYATAVILGLPNARIEKAIKAEYFGPNSSLCGERRTQNSIKIYTYIANRKKNYAPFPENYFEKIEKMAEFIIDISKPDGSIPQIGDNDSGRFFKLDPCYEVSTVAEIKAKYANMKSYNEKKDDEIYYLEKDLNSFHIIFAANAIFERNDFSNWLKRFRKNQSSPDYVIMKLLSNDFRAPSYRRHTSIKDKEENQFGSQKILNKTMNSIKEIDLEKITLKEFYSAKGDLVNDLSMISYPQFGLFLYKSDNLYIAIRCITDGATFSTCHTHFDQFNIELMIDSEDIIIDPGSYVYEPFPELRKLYRSAESHHSPLINQDRSQESSYDLFGEIEVFKANPIYFQMDGFLAFLTKDDNSEYLLIHLLKDCLKIYYVGKQNKNIYENKKVSYSPGYGKRIIN